MAKIVGFIVGLVVFSVWMNIVGNPHVVETVLGVGISIFAGAWVWRWLVRRVGHGASERPSLKIL